jgi:hypothetical protein
VTTGAGPLAMQGDNVVGVIDGNLRRVLSGGTLDPAFGTDAGGGTPILDANALAAAADGSMYLASMASASGSLNYQTRTQRYSATGVPDLSYGVGGVADLDVLTDDYPGAWFEEPQAVAVYPNGTVAMSVKISPTGGGIPAPGGALVQFTPTGQPDENFDGDGIRYVSLSPSGATRLGDALIIDPQGRLIAGGTRTQFAGQPFASVDAVIARFGTGTENEPHVTSVDVVPNPTQLVVRCWFDQNVGASIERTDLKLRSLDGSNAIVAGANTATYDTLNNSATFAFSTALASGLFRLSLVHAGILNTVGNSLDATKVLDVAYVGQGKTVGLPAGTTRVNAVSVAGRLDVGTNALVVDYAGPSLLGAAGTPGSGVARLIASGFAAGSWNGSGIITSVGAGLSAVGYAEAAEVLGISGNQTAVWKGVTVDATSLLLRHTYYGDADLNGQVTLDDFTLFLHGYQAPLPATSNWLNGDFDYSGTVTLDDFTLFLRGYQQQGTPL